MRPSRRPFSRRLRVSGATATVLREELRNLGRVGTCPVADALHRGRLERKFTPLDEQAPDRAVGVTVLVRVADPQQGTVREPDASGPLDLQEEEVQGVVYPGQFASRERRASPVDFGA
nr:hypothetical protein [Mycobacterium tuberculosis]